MYKKKDPFFWPYQLSISTKSKNNYNSSELGAITFTYKMFSGIPAKQRECLSYISIFHNTTVIQWLLAVITRDHCTFPTQQQREKNERNNKILHWLTKQGIHMRVKVVFFVALQLEWSWTLAKEFVVIVASASRVMTKSLCKIYWETAPICRLYAHDHSMPLAMMMIVMINIMIMMC